MIHAPADQLGPAGWVCTRNDVAEIVFEPDEWSGEVRATRQAEDRWQIQCIERCGEAESTRTVGYTSTRDDTLLALTECMTAMNRVRDRTGVVRSMLTSALALRQEPVRVRTVSPERRTADAPFEEQLPPSETRRSADTAGSGKSAWIRARTNEDTEE